MKCKICNTLIVAVMTLSVYLVMSLVIGSRTASELRNQNNALEVQVQQLTKRVEFLEPQVHQWRNAYETIQQIRGAKKN